MKKPATRQKTRNSRDSSPKNVAQDFATDPKNDPSPLLLVDYPDEKWLRSLRMKAMNWFEKNSRELPWRSHNTPYRVWVSEIMLQQTQVQTVIEYFHRFIQRFPSIESLANADESDVLTHWEGLGYYRRARNLHAAAKQIVELHQGSFPESFDEVIQLAGIGRYTAGAILSIALDQRLPILEGNTYRLHARLLGLNEDPRSRDAEKLLWRFAEDLLPGKQSPMRAGLLNQSLMEIGSQVCKSSKPDCGSCPLKSICAARRLGLEQELPRSNSTTRYEDLHQVLLLLEDDNARLLVRQRQPNEWWSGLWDFVRMDVPNPDVADNLANRSQQIDQMIAENYGIRLRLPSQPDFTLKHAVTKYRIRLDCFHLRKQTWKSNGSFQLEPLSKIADLPLNVTARKALNRITTNRSASSS